MSKQENDLYEQEQKQIDMANEQFDKLANLLSCKKDKQDTLSKKTAATLQECKQKSEKYVQDMQNRYQATLEVYQIIAAIKALQTLEATPAKLQAPMPSTLKTPLVSLLVSLCEHYEVLFLTHSCFTGLRHPAWIQLSHQQKQPKDTPLVDKLLNNFHAYSPGVYRQIGTLVFLWRWSPSRPRMKAKSAMTKMPTTTWVWLWKMPCKSYLNESV